MTRVLPHLNTPQTTTLIDALVVLLENAQYLRRETIGQLWQQDLPDGYYQQYGKAINAVTKADMVRVAKEYIDLDHLSIVIVGDRATIEGPLKATGVAPIVVLDIEGNRGK